MDKKYQVFISSTYADMKAERQAAVEAILDAGHIPVGMELFAASDRTALEVIKNWIDKSDIFMLILGGRYGSVEPESGKSYIQLEYEYAVETGKPFFALYLTDKAINDKVKEHGTDVIEQNDTKKLNDFRALVKSKLCSEINDVKDIHRHVQKSIYLAEGRKLEGWVRASSVPDLPPLNDKIAAMAAENQQLKNKLEQATGKAARLQKTNSDLRDSWDREKEANSQLKVENSRLQDSLRETKRELLGRMAYISAQSKK
jgi:nucleoside 2-deoxyribosyltransferase